MMENRKTAIITGGASGIGAATARRFAEAGWFIGLFDVDYDGAAALAQELGADCALAQPVDVTERQSWDAAVAAFGKATGGRLDLLFNNAGILSTGRFEDIAGLQTDRIIAVNLNGAINGIAACLPLLKATTDARIINNTSLSACYGTPGAAVYAATKAALRNLSEALAIEFAYHGISVIYILPGFIRTPMFDGPDNENNALIRSSIQSIGASFRSPQRVADVVWRAAHSQRRHWSVGRETVLIAFFAMYFPGIARLLYRRICKSFWHKLDR